MRKLIYTAALGALVAAPGHAGQPIKESLVECAVLVELLLGEQSFVPGQDEMLDIYTKAAVSMRAEATRQADAGYVSQVSAVKRDLWHQRWDEGQWDDPNNRADLAEWWTYCFKLAKHLDLKLEP